MPIVHLALLSAAYYAPLDAPVTVPPAAAGFNVLPRATRPNVLLIVIDDMGYSDMEPFGAPNVSTPHVNALVKSGVKLTQWISAASICTPSRASMQTGRYPIRTGCMGDKTAHRVIPTPASPGGLDPQNHMSIASALRLAGYNTGMSGKWHLGVNHDKQDRRFTPNAHGYQTYVGSPFTNAPMCAMDSDGFAAKHKEGPTFCFVAANDTVVQQPMAIENFTSTITKHAVAFLRKQTASTPWYFFMSYFHVHTPHFVNRANKGRSRNGPFGDSVEEMDDSVGELMATLAATGADKNTLVLLTSDNGPYQEEGWAKAGRTNLYAPDGRLLGRMKGGKGQLYEGGVRMPGAAVWPGVIAPGSVSDSMVSTMDIFPTVVAAAGVTLPAGYIVDGKDMAPVLANSSAPSAHDVFLHYCGFTPIAARVFGRWKLFWATQRWYSFDAADFSICTQCCNGVVPSSTLFGINATYMCECDEAALVWHTAQPVVYDMATDQLEEAPLNSTNWPSDAPTSYVEVWKAANATRDAMVAAVHPKPDRFGAGTCTAGIPSPKRQPCCAGCHKTLIGEFCVNDSGGGKCTCNDV